MIVGDVINQVAVIIKDRNNVPFPAFNLRILDVVEDKDVTVIKYEVTFDYGNAGKIVLTGEVYEKGEEHKLAKFWKDNNKLPNDYVPQFMSFVNWIATVHATVICQTIRFRPPLLPLTFNVKE